MTTRKTSAAVAEAKKAGAKTPEDFKEKMKPFNQVEGHELLKPLQEVPLEDAFDLLEIFDTTDGDGDFTMKEMRPILKAIRANFVADEEGFNKFAVASNMEPAIELVVAYLGELSKDVA